MMDDELKDPFIDDATDESDAEALEEDFDKVDEADDDAMWDEDTEE